MIRSLRKIRTPLLSTAMMSSNSGLSVDVSDGVAWVTLNRPKALNSLNLEMCENFNSYLKPWVLSGEKHGLGAMVVKGSGGKAFCAGGDVKAVWEDCVKGGPDLGTGKPGRFSSDFFRAEYEMNYMLGISDLPQISLWDGIVMGGGVGISVLGEYRIATENTMFAMPETTIGLFPDVGSSSWLPHLPGGLENTLRSLAVVWGPLICSLLESPLTTSSPARSMPSNMLCLNK